MKRIRVSNCFISVLLGVMPSLVNAQATEMVSVSTSGIQGNPSSSYPSISADGHYVAFQSNANNLVSGDTNGTTDIFVRDRVFGTTDIVSINSSGIQGNGSSTASSISADGRFVAFQSNARNLVAGDTNGTTDIFVRDRDAGTTEIVSISSTGIIGNSTSQAPSISADGRYAAFQSLASNLVNGDTNGNWDVFVHDRETGITERVSISSSGIEGNGVSLAPSISADGRYVAFESYAKNFVAGDTNGATDIFVYDREKGAIERVSIASTGTQGNGPSNAPSISADGRYVAFESYATNLINGGDTNGTTDIYIRDRIAGITERVSVSNAGTQVNGASTAAAISQDGRYIVFESSATNLVVADSNGTKDVFVRDRDEGKTERVSVSSDGIQGNGASTASSISEDGRYVAFGSSAANLVPGDSNGVQDVFVRDRGPLNNPPVADAGPDQRVSCSGPEGAAVILDGSNSSDPDGDELTYTWTGPFGTAPGVNPSFEIPFGAYTINLKVDDGKGGTGDDTVTITVEDRIAPSTTASIESTTGMAAASEWYRTAVNVKLLATDNCSGCAKIYSILDGVNAVTNGSTANILISGDGIHGLSYWSIDRLGNEEQKKTLTVKLDKAKPTITAVLDPAPNVQGWNNTDVTVTFVCKDSLSGMASCPSPVKVTNDGAGQIISGQAIDNAGNSETVSVAVSIDKTPPTITAALSPEPNAQGWNNADVTVTFTCSDTGSEIIACPLPIKVTTDGAAQVVSGEAVNYAGISALASVTLNIDKTPPTITAALSPEPNAQGWNNTDVTVAFICKDSVSGIASCPSPVQVSSEKAGQLITGQAIDNAGTSQTVSVAVSIDKTPPAITAVVDPAPNAQGWNNADVTVTFVCKDSGSGIIACPSPVKVTTEGGGQVIYGKVFDNAGNSASASVTLNIDKTPPVISISTDPRLLWPANGKMVKVFVSGNVSDASQVRSIAVGVKDEYGTVQPSLDRLNTTVSLEARRDGNDRDGRHYTIEAVAIDIAGNNSSATTEVIVPHDMRK